MIDGKTRVIFYDLEKKKYQVGTLGKRRLEEMPVCTVDHFFHAVCSFFEEVTPNIEENPIYQDVNWAEIDTQIKTKAK